MGQNADFAGVSQGESLGSRSRAQYGTAHAAAQGGLASAASGGKRDKAVIRYAEQPGETLNADICFVPVVHLAEVTMNNNIEEIPE